MYYDGWVLRFAEGYTRRANSIYPIYPSSQAIDIHEKIQSCESVYRNHGLKTIFKLTAAVHPLDLDNILANHGYALEAQTSTQILPLADWDESPALAAQIVETLSDEWLSAFCRMSAVDIPQRHVLAYILNGIVPTHCFAALHQEGQIVACGMGVVQGDFVGLFDIVTDPLYRGQGFGRQLLLNILAWGKSHGAQTAYLQVMLNNAPALHLYSRLGFSEIYQYWYRVKQ